MRIGELADRLGVTTKAIRFYESIGLLPDPSRTPSGYRSYEETDAERLVFIKTAQRLGLSLDEIKEIIAFRDRGEQPCEYVAEVLQRQVTDLDKRIREMRRLRDELRRLQVSAAAGVAAESRFCAVIEHPHVRRRRGEQASSPSSPPPPPAVGIPRRWRTVPPGHGERSRSGAPQGPGYLANS